MTIPTKHQKDLDRPRRIRGRLFAQCSLLLVVEGIGVRTIIKFGEELGDNIGDAPNIVGTGR